MSGRRSIDNSTSIFGCIGRVKGEMPGANIPVADADTKGKALDSRHLDTYIKTSVSAAKLIT